MSVSEGEMIEQNEFQGVQEVDAAVAFTETSPEVEATEASAENAPAEPKDSRHKQVFDGFLAELAGLDSPEAKLQHAINFMEATISQATTPHFKSFWDARTLCLDFFKQNINPILRATLWAKYIELSKEARRVKEILEEQSAFASEQIDLAIQALENDIARNGEVIDTTTAAPLAITCVALQKKLPYYVQIQGELDLLNTQAARINGLRKELIKTEMRIRQKNRFFQRLSAAGDKVFPRRKDLIKELSNTFIEDVEAFIRQNFNGEEGGEALFELREEIKSLQGAAKLLTLNTHSFTHTRLRLSECWDSIKEHEKERKKERAQQRTVFRQNFTEVQDKIRAFNETFQTGSLTIAEASKQLDAIALFMREVDLGRDEVKDLREELQNARKPILDKQKEDEQQRLRQEEERDRARKQRIQELHAECAALLARVNELDADTLTAERDALALKVTQASITKIEKQELERILKPLRDIISEKKEQALLSLSDDDRQMLGQLKQLLKEKKERRQEIRNQVEVLRKACGSSGLDFEQSMRNNAQLEEERESLERINAGIKEIEDKIDEVESN